MNPSISILFRAIPLAMGPCASRSGSTSCRAAICFSILSKVLLLALVWRRVFALANRIPIIPVATALACLFFAAFLFEATMTQPGFFVGAHVLVGLGAVCFTLFSIVSILEAGTSK